MSVETTMYALKPIITGFEITRNDDRMYAMKNIHDSRRNYIDHASKDIVADLSEKSPLPEVAILEARQEKILAQLAELKAQVLSLCDVLKVTAHEPTSESECLAEPVSMDLVINVDPLKPCYAIRALQKIWKDVDLRVTAFRHSSVSQDVPEIKSSPKQGFRDVVNVSLIWKKVDDLEMVVSGIRGYPIIGESNMLRYIARRLPTKNYESLLSPRDMSTLDSLLDIAHRLRYQDTPKDVQSTLTFVAKKLGTNDKNKNWLSNDDAPGIVDVAVWSAVKQIFVAKPPSVIGDWFQRCEKIFLH